MLHTENKDLWNEERINKVLEFSKFAVWSLSLEKGLFHLSTQCRSLLEIPEDYKFGLNDLKEFFLPENFSYQYENFRKSWESGVYDANLRMRTFKNNLLWVHVHSITEYDLEGKPILVYGIINDITEIKQQEIRLREQKAELERTHRLLNKTEEVGKLGHWTFDRKSTLFSLSREASSICGLGADSFLSKEVFNPLINPKNQNWPYSNPPQAGTYIHEITAGKERKWVEVNVDAEYEDSEAVFGTIQDITHEIRAKRKALNDEAKQKAIINTIPNAFFYTDTRGIIRQVNKAFATLVGFSQHQLVGSSIYDCLPFEDVESMIIKDKLLLSSRQQTMECETKIKRNGEVKTIKLYKSTFENTSGKTLGFIGIIFNLSEEIKKNAQLKLYNKQMNLAMGGANAGFFIYDIQRDLNYWDEKTSEMFGFSPEPQIGPIEDFLKAIHPEDRMSMESQKANNYVGIDRIDEHYRIIRKGKVRYINAQGVVERDELGEPIKILGIHFDETDRVLSQKNLIESEKKYRRIFESIKDGYLLFDMDGKIVNANPASAKLLGYKSAHNLIGNRFKDFCSEHSINFDFIKEELLKGGDLESIKVELLKKNGQIIIADFHAHINNYDGCSIIEATFRDVTQDVQTQEKIIKATIQAEDNQRKRIAQSLHDSVQQILIISKMNFESLKEALENLSPEQVKRFELGLKFLNEGLHETRSVSHELMPAVVEDFGIYSVIESFVSYLNQSSDIDFHFESNVKDKDFDKQLEISLYRILQEATSNILKYSKASEAHIQLRVNKNRLSLTIEDNGVGFDVNSALGEKSFGITGMRNRATSIGAYFEVESKKSQGTIILVEIEV